MKIITSQENYLTSYPALNLACGGDDTGDWHYQEFFHGVNGREPGPFLIAGIDLKSTQELFGEQGIYDSAKFVPNSLKITGMPIHTADHYRAVADMIFNFIIDNRNYARTLDLEGWFAGEKDKKALAFYVEKIAEHFGGQVASQLRIWFAGLNI